MKKYVKPELFFESFELSQSIAACGIDVNLASKAECAKLDGNFWPGLDGTQVFSVEDNCANNIEDFGVYCHTSGTSEAGRLFNS